MGKKRLAIAAVVVLLLAGTTVLLWHVLDWPPPRLILKYGFPPAGGPTGRTWTNSLGTREGSRWASNWETPDQETWR